MREEKGERRKEKRELICFNLPIFLPDCIVQLGDFQPRNLFT
jgi:hypothetical protein